MAWYQALKSLSDKDGQQAFSELSRSTTYGDPEPAHVLEIAEKQRQMWVNREDDINPWISKAPKFEGEKFEDINTGMPTRAYQLWKQANEHKRYRATNQQDEIFLIQNPECWDWKVHGGKICYIRPDPIDTGEKRADGIKQKQRPAWAQR